jgi:hypothetical protein
MSVKTTRLCDMSFSSSIWDTLVASPVYDKSLVFERPSRRTGMLYDELQIKSDITKIRSLNDLHGNVNAKHKQLYTGRRQDYTRKPRAALTS